MSDDDEPKPAAPPPRPMMRGPMGMNMGPPQKAKTFGASARRLLGAARAAERARSSS